MKNLIAFLLLTVAALAASAPVVRVDNLGNAYLVNADGSETNLGTPYDAMANNPGLASAIQTGAVAALAKFKAESAAAVKAAQDAAAAQVLAKEAEKVAAIAAAEASRAAAVTAADKARDDAIAAHAAAKVAEIVVLRARVAELEAAAATSSSSPIP